MKRIALVKNQTLSIVKVNIWKRLIYVGNVVEQDTVGMIVEKILVFVRIQMVG